MPEVEDTQFGFQWGPMKVTRIASWPRSNADRISRALGVETERVALEIYVSPTGKSVRVFKNGRELK